MTGSGCILKSIRCFWMKRLFIQNQALRASLMRISGERTERLFVILIICFPLSMTGSLRALRIPATDTFPISRMSFAFTEGFPSKGKGRCSTASSLNLQSLRNQRKTATEKPRFLGIMPNSLFWNIAEPPGWVWGALLALRLQAQRPSRRKRA